MIKKLPSVAYALFAFGCAFLQRPLQADPINRKGTPFPNQNLTKIYQGQDISTALGSNKHSVADWYGQTDSGFDDLCKRDRSMRADKQGRLHYVCAAPSVQQGSSSAWGYTGTTLAAPYADSQTFLLHSKPGATKVIYLCFTGFTTGGTAWNASYTSGANIVTPPYDIDGNPSAFSTTELANIQNIWLSVAEDYAPFDVDVTTQDPGVEALRKTSTTDAYYGIRVCIGGSSLDWYCYTAGGVAYLNSFDWDTDTPAFVFPAQLGTGNPKFVAEAAAHEAGHTLGLHHDGLTASSPSGFVTLKRNRW